MGGALRLVSVEQGYDPRDYALIAFGGAGPLHANALARLLGSWPAIIPPGPGVLCALGDATTAVRDERARTYIRGFSDCNAKDLVKMLRELGAAAAASLQQEGVPPEDTTTSYQVDLRYRGQGLRLTVEFDIGELARRGLPVIARRFDEEHRRLFTFALELEHELVTLRATVQGKGIRIKRRLVPKGSPDPRAAILGTQKAYMDGRDVKATIYDRALLKAGNRIAGPAIVIEMDSTTLILPGHFGLVDGIGCILIQPLPVKPSKKRG
jgi:N-methylhydantoinase A